MKDIEKMSYEEALKELSELVERLERGDAPLEESMALYERGVKLSKHCQTILTSMEEKMTKLALQEDGSLLEEDLEV